ncbi:acetylornithine deacetylase [Pleionea litopenaei]|uniref:Acetylornithine deacetylase n=1 Tax=Pleionea litopenaei TaxID=3070815 RepID=A0AA51RRX0_9GAMM|nr:acetylornithine deacetylase [Pleionea sp. HL-JVS1]WMS86475.1 acetylornithine deacetylase [Pleionea sp. HL-JVS1]
MFRSKILHNLLKPLVGNNTVSADQPSMDQPNKPYLEVLADWLEPLGFNIHLSPVPESNQKWNLVAHRPGLDTQEGGIAFIGHSDTVTADLSQWHHDPWQLQQQEDRFAGLGTTDMKSFFAVVTAMLQQLPNTSKPMTIIATADEETSMAGARAIKQHQLRRPDLAIIGEPTSMIPIISHKGYLAYRLTIKGAGGHSSNNSEQVNCLNALFSAASQLHRVAAKLRQYCDPRFSVPEATMNFGTLNAGDSVNRICASAELCFDIRPIPGLDPTEITIWLQHAIKEGLKGFQVNYTLTDLYPPVHGFSSSLPIDLQAHLSQCCGHPCHTANYVTEAGFIEQLGTPTIILGPGDIAQAHTPNEWISFEQLYRAEQIYQKLLLRFSG